MASETIYLQGIANWARVLPHNKDKNEDFHGPGGGYTIDLVVDKENLDKYVASGGRVRPKSGDDGVFLKLKRRHTHQGGISEFGGPPQVVDKDKNPWDGTIIGNGSEVEVALEVYDTKMGKGTRLAGVRVLDLVELPPLEDAEGGGQKLPF